MKHDRRFPFLLALLLWAASQTPGSQALAQNQTTVGTSAPGSSANRATVAGPDLEKPLITIPGLCELPKGSACETVITRAQFEKVVDAIQPGMSKQGRREFALNYADALVMAQRAHEMGLDKGETFDEQMRLARIQILSQALKKAVQEKASQISPKDIEDFYAANQARFEKADIERIYVPKARVWSSSAAIKLSDAERQNQSAESQNAMKQEADALRARAAGGESFAALQAEAYQQAGIKVAPPGTSLSIRLISLPPAHASVMDLKPGEVSAVMTDPNGYFIYKMKSKDILPVDQVRNEITEALRSQRVQEAMHHILDSAEPRLDASYFAR